MDFGRQRRFLHDGKDPPEKVCCRNESYFLQFMYVDGASAFVGVVFYCYYCYYYCYGRTNVWMPRVKIKKLWLGGKP